ncbi:MAG: PAS domain-containing protein [Candidatus Methylomirabilales bacterium]
MAKDVGGKLIARRQGEARPDRRQPEGLLNFLLSCLEVGVLALDREGRIITTNPAWGTLLGLPRRHLPGKGFSAAFPRPLRTRARALLDELGRKKGPVELVLAEGGLHLKGTTWKRGLLLLLTEQPHLREWALIQQILDSLPLGLYVIDRSFTIVAWNRTRETAPSGMRREEVIGRTLFQVLPSLRRTAIAEEFRRVFETGESLHVEEESVVEGERRTFRISKVPLTNGAGQVTHVITLVEDITERRRMERQLLASEKLAGIGQLASGIAHELNNPMATIASCAEALLKHNQNFPPTLQDAEDLKLYLRIIEEEVYRCKGILAGLSDLSREGSGEQRPIDLRGLLEGTLSVLGYQLRSRGITLTRDFEVGLPLLLGNEGELRQALLALLINTIEAMEGGGTLTVRARTAGSGVRGAKGSPVTTRYPRPTRWVQVEVEDTGRGIPPDLLPRVCEPFFSTKPPGKGAGLGLYIAEGIVSAHGGRMEIHSEKGKGTVVRIHLPPATTQIREGP